MVSSTNKTDCHNITEILLKVALNTITLTSDLRQVGGFLHVLWFPPPIKVMATILTEILLKVALNTMTPLKYTGKKNLP